jgi:hypothetical protein
MSSLRRISCISVAVLVLAALGQVNLAIAPAASAGTPGDSSTVDKTASQSNTDKVYFTVTNKEQTRIMDFHVRIIGATITSVSTPNGWTSENKSTDGKPIVPPGRFPCYGVNWTANGTQNAIPPGGSIEEFDIVISNQYNCHFVHAWVTYEQPGDPPGVPGTREHSYTEFSQWRKGPGSPWETRKLSTPQPTRESIGSGGGSMGMGTDGKVDVPAGAVSADTWFSAYVLPEDIADYVGPTVDGGRVYKAFRLGPDGHDFALPITLTLSYASVKELRNPRAYLYDLEQNKWAKVVEAQVDPGAKQIVLQTTHFSVYGIGGDPAPVGGLAELPETAKGGATLYALWAAATLVAAAMLCGVWYLARRQQTR